ncbi:MAG: hypothetical protein ACKN85_16635 [Pirellula sp.]
MSREDVFDAMQHWKQLRDAGVKIVTYQRGELDFSNLGGVVFGYDREIYDETGRLVKRVRYYERFKKPPTWKSKQNKNCTRQQFHVLQHHGYLEESCIRRDASSWPLWPASNLA